MATDEIEYRCEVCGAKILAPTSPTTAPGRDPAVVRHPPLSQGWQPTGAGGWRCPLHLTVDGA